MKAKRPTGKMAQVLSEHIEKILLGVAALMGLLIIWMGFQNRQGIEPSKTPSDLQQQVSMTTSHIEGFGWDKDYKTLRTQDENLLERANETLRHVKVTDYAAAQYLKAPYHPPRKTRTDPALFAASQLQARAGWGLLAKPSGSRENTFFRPGQAEEEEGRSIPNGYGGSSARGRDGLRGAGTGNENVEGTYFVVVTGLIPYRQQYQEFFNCFKTADAFNPNRDIPRYVNWSLQRAPAVTGDGEPQWKEVANRLTFIRETRRWERSGRSDDSIDPRANFPELTSPNPPIDGIELERLARHDKILTMKEARRRERNSRGDGRGNRFDRGGGDRGPRGGDFGGGQESGREMMPESQFSTQTRRPRPSRDGQRSIPGDGGLGGDSSYGQMTGYENMDPKDVPEYAMFRYFDFDVSVNQSYIYRLQLEVEDPNCPRDRRLDPDASALSDEVQLRLNQQKDRKSQLPTDFSGSSNVVTVALGQRILLGTVDAARELFVAAAGTSYQPATSEAKAKVIVMEFDAKGKRELPVEITVQPGSVGYYRGKVEPVYRWKNWLGKPEEGTPIRVNSVVLALRGGEEVGKGKLTEPGEMLAWNAATGKLVVHSEFEDADEYPNFVFPPEDRNGMGSEFGGDSRRGPRGRDGRDGGDGAGLEGGDSTRRRGGGGDRRGR